MSKKKLNKEYLCGIIEKETASRQVRKLIFTALFQGKTVKIRYGRATVIGDETYKKSLESSGKA